ncbi:MAG: hypothetical protein DRJ51_03690 [Thermoprotei archaeon]|nr:MAG: hypothetical protein DRJ51_03690 [Thermoprotei archaeon]RLF02195.1 MAG: hypothetical protein DRJ59_04255 [Thermoprotei archaeon]
MGEKQKVVITKLVIDALKPRELSIIDLAAILCSIDKVEQVSISVREVDVKTETIRITVQGNDLEYPIISDVLVESGIAIRSIDEVSAEKP